MLTRSQQARAPFAFQNVDMGVLLMEKLRAVIEYCLTEARLVCGSARPTFYLAGFSAGASMSAAIAHEYPEVTKMLLISPSADISTDVLRDGPAKYRGELYITLGDSDAVVGPKAAQTLADWATKARFTKVVVVPHCDHQFTGETNGRILSKTYLWAFNDDQTYPSPKGGIKLY